MHGCRGGRTIWWSVVSGQWSVVSGQWSVVSGQWLGRADMIGLGKATGRLVHVLLALFYGAFILFGLVYLWRELP